jgi:hypothetical protein
VKAFMAIAIFLSACLFLSACNQGDPPRPEGAQGRPQEEELTCKDFTSPQEIFAAEQEGKLTEAEVKAMDKDGNRVPCDEKGGRLKDTTIHIEGLASFEIVGVADYQGVEGGIRAGSLTIDVHTGGQQFPPESLETIGWVAIDRVNRSSEPDYEALDLEFRDIRTYRVIALGVYVRDEEAAASMNEYYRGQGLKVDWVRIRGKVPKSGDISVTLWQTPTPPATASPAPTATATPSPR